MPLGPVDVVLGCGDLDVCFLADAFRARLLYILGNHDRGGRWTRGAVRRPSPAGRISEEAGLRIVGLSSPGRDAQGTGARRDDIAAWRDVLQAAGSLVAARLRGRSPLPVMVSSHGAPRGLGNGADRYQAGFGAHRWLLERLYPPLWLHRHTHPASIDRRRVSSGRTVVLNVTGSVPIELWPPDAVQRRRVAGAEAGGYGQAPGRGR